MYGAIDDDRIYGCGKLQRTGDILNFMSILNLPILGKASAKVGFNDDTLLAIDIGTETLKMLLFTCDEAGVNILKSSRIFQQQHAMRSGVIKSLDTVIENCHLGYNEVIEGIDEKNHPKRVVMGIAGELVHGVSIVVNYDREDRTSKEIDAKEQENIFGQVKANVFNDGRNELAERYGMDPADIDVLHITITGLEVGGMNVDSLVGYTGKQVRLNFYASFAPRTYIEALKKVAVSLNLEVMGIVSQPFAMARVFAGSSDRDFNGVFIDVGGGTTDIALVQGGNVADTQIFAFGGRVFTKRIAREMNLDFRHAESRKIKYSEGSLDAKISDKIKKIIAKDLGVWVEGLKFGLTSMEDVDSFPPYLYLCGGGAMLPDLRRAIMEYPWTVKMKFMRFPKVLIVMPDKLEKIVDKSGALKDPIDITPAGLARFAWDKIKYPEKHFSTNV